MLKIPSRFPGGKEIVTLDRNKVKNPWTFSVFGRLKLHGVFRADKNFWQKTSGKTARKMFKFENSPEVSYGANLVFQSLDPLLTFHSEIRIFQIMDRPDFSQQPEVPQ